MTETYSYLDSECKYVIIQPFHHKQDATRGQFFSGIMLV